MFYRLYEIKGTTPDYINSILKTNSEVYNVSIRFLKKCSRGRAFCVRRILTWNELSTDNKKGRNVKFFEKKFIVYIFN